jgi:hypothetical protein
MRFVAVDVAQLFAAKTAASRSQMWAGLMMQLGLIQWIV